MFDIGFGELLLVMVIGLVVLGPERLPVAVKTVASWIRTLRSLASTVQNELSQELKLQELQDSLKKVEQASLKNLSPELKASMDELKEAAESMRRGYVKPLDGNATQAEGDATPTVHKPLADAEAVHDGVLTTERAAGIEPTVEQDAVRTEAGSVGGAVAPSAPPRADVPPTASVALSPAPHAGTQATVVSGPSPAEPEKQAASVEVSTTPPSQPRDDR